MCSSGNKCCSVDLSILGGNKWRGTSRKSWGVIVVAKVGEQLGAVVRLKKGLQVPEGQISWQAHPVLVVGGCLVVHLRTPWVEWADGEQADKLLGRESLVLVKVMLCKESRQEIETSLNTTK